MADLSITASQVLKSTNAVLQHGTAGATVTAFQPCYLDASDNLLKLADANASEATAAAIGIALHASLSGQPLTIQTAGTVIGGAAASIVQGEIYVVSATAGGVAPEGDLTTGHFNTILGIGDASDGIVLNIAVSGVVLP